MAFAAILAGSADRPSAHGALLLKAGFESLLAARKVEIEEANQAALKEETDAYKQATEGDWLEGREKYYAAMSSSEYLAVRAALVDWLISWLGDAVRQKVASLYPKAEVDPFTNLFWGRIQKWREDNKS